MFISIKKNIPPMGPMIFAIENFIPTIVLVIATIEAMFVSIKKNIQSIGSVIGSIEGMFYPIGGKILTIVSVISLLFDFFLKAH